VQYGEPYEPSRIPFSNFAVAIEAGAADSATLNLVQVNGALKQWRMKETERNNHLFSITMNYDYFNNSAFEYGGQSFNFKLLSAWNRDRKNKLFSSIGAGVIVLAAVPDDYLYYGEGRNYDYGPGASITASGGINIKDKLQASINYSGGWFITLNGNESSFFLNTVSGELRYWLWKKISLAVGGGHFSLNGYYKDYDDVSKRFPFIRYSIGYRF
jgi:hypothetical protein